MNLRADFHTHTTFCDGKNTPRQMVESAFRKGLTDFGISGHGDYSFCEPGFGMNDRILEEYRRELEQLRDEYRGRMNLYIGIELDCLGPVQKAEYSIGSTHCVKKNGEFISVDDTEEKLTEAVDRLWKGDWYAFIRDYYELEATVWDRTRCTWIGHFDLLTKFNEGGKYFDETSDAYLEPALTAMKYLQQAEVPFEINTGAIGRKYRTAPYPSSVLLRELCQMGGRIIINSDSHSTEHICGSFELAQKLAWDCGFRRVSVLKPGGGFREIEL